jgi:hypothetical protein
MYVFLLLSLLSIIDREPEREREEVGEAPAVVVTFCAAI